jgi:hypothetical protein
MPRVTTIWLLRIENADERHAAYRSFVADLRAAASAEKTAEKKAG